MILVTILRETRIDLALIDGLFNIICLILMNNSYTKLYNILFYICIKCFHVNHTHYHDHINHDHKQENVVVEVELTSSV